jgi:hypothetical protein
MKRYIGYEVDIKTLQEKINENELFDEFSVLATEGVDMITIKKILAGEQKPTYLAMCELASALALSNEEASEIFFKPKLT